MLWNKINLTYVLTRLTHKNQNWKTGMGKKKTAKPTKYYDRYINVLILWSKINEVYVDYGSFDFQ